MSKNKIWDVINGEKKLVSETDLVQKHDNTLKCLSNGTPNTTTFPFVPNGKDGY